MTVAVHIVDESQGQDATVALDSDGKVTVKGSLFRPDLKVAQEVLDVIAKANRRGKQEADDA